ncbi:hypothetical protein GCM10010532_058440 [Dactylosporangium siamense]
MLLAQATTKADTNTCHCTVHPPQPAFTQLTHPPAAKAASARAGTDRPTKGALPAKEAGTNSAKITGGCGTSCLRGAGGAQLPQSGSAIAQPCGRLRSQRLSDEAHPGRV